MDLNQHLVNCPKCGKSVNGHVILGVAQDDWQMFKLGEKIYDALVLKKKITFGRAPISSKNHFLHFKCCFLCGQ